MEPGLSLSATNFALSVRLDTESETSDQEAGCTLSYGDLRKPARSFSKVARGRKDMREVRAAASASARGAAGVRPGRLPRTERKGSARQLVWPALLALILVGVVLAHVWLRLQVVKTGYVLSTASKLQSRLEQENRELQIELATLTSPDRLEALARRRLGLGAPEKGQVIILP